MKKILILAALIFAAIELNAHGACLIENLKIKSTCTGGASDITIPDELKPEQGYSSKKELEKMYQIPTMAVPNNLRDNFPMLNQNCMFGACFLKY